MFRSSLIFAFALAVLAFVAGFAAMVQEGGGPSESEKLDSANRRIDGLRIATDSLRSQNEQLSRQLSELSGSLKETKNEQFAFDLSHWDELSKRLDKQTAKLEAIGTIQTVTGKSIEELFSEQEKYAERSEEKLDVLAERFDFGDARMREVAAAQEDFAKLGEKIRKSTAFDTVATLDLTEVGKALSDRVELAARSIQESPDGQEPLLDPLEKRHSKLQLVLARAEEEYAVVFAFREPGNSVVDLTSQVVEMIRELPDDDPILSDL